MALNCQVTLSYRSYQAGQTPAPKAIITCYNTGAAAVSVTGVEMVFRDSVGVQLRNLSTNRPVVPVGVGQSVSVASLGTLIVGPFDITIGSPAAASSFQMVPPGAQPPNPQLAHPMQQQIFVGATVYASDGTVNTAGSDGLLVSYTVPPPLGFQGGFAHFAAPNNAALSGPA